MRCRLLWTAQPCGRECVCVCSRACVRACVFVCLCVCACVMLYGISAPAWPKCRRTPLMLAAYFGREEMVTTLIERMADIHAADCAGYAQHHPPHISQSPARACMPACLQPLHPHCPPVESMHRPRRADAQPPNSLRCESFALSGTDRPLQPDRASPRRVQRPLWNRGQSGRPPRRRRGEGTRRVSSVYQCERCAVPCSPTAIADRLGLPAMRAGDCAVV